MEIDQSITVKGDDCALMIIKVKKALQSLKWNGLLEVNADNEDCQLNSIRSFCESTGNTFVSIVTVGTDSIKVYLRHTPTKFGHR